MSLGSSAGIVDDVYSLYHKVTGFVKRGKILSHRSFLMYTDIYKAEKEQMLIK